MCVTDGNEVGRGEIDGAGVGTAVGMQVAIASIWSATAVSSASCEGTVPHKSLNLISAPDVLLQTRVSCCCRFEKESTQYINDNRPSSEGTCPTKVKGLEFPVGSSVRYL